MLFHVILNGERPNKIDIPEGAKVIAADGALKFCEERGIRVLKAVGDFDSYGSVPDGAAAYPTDKDLTDGEIALRTACEMGATEIVLWGFGGLREDHFLCNLNLLEIADLLGASAKAVTNYSEIYYAKGEFFSAVNVGATVSVIAAYDSLIAVSDGLKYPYSETVLRRASTLGISNVATKDKIYLSVKSGGVFVIINKF